MLLVVMETKSMKAQKFEHLINGGAAEIGASGLLGEIAALETERSKHAEELAEIPARRVDLLLGDDSKNAVDKLEALESDLYRFIERIDLQTSALRERLPRQGNVERQALIEHHRSVLIAAAAEVEKSVVAAMRANAAANAAFEEARRDLGTNEANYFMPMVEFGGNLHSDCLKIWRSNMERQTEKIARQGNTPSWVPHRSAFKWENAGR
jgi:hypothetical protein